MDVKEISTEFLKHKIKVITRELNNRNQCSGNYEAGYKLLMQYFDSINDEEKIQVSNQLTQWGL